jgi:ubiquinone/menaquinone biosynthesis C-methylase UbiE
MDHDDHVSLLRDGIAAPGGVWADLGSGWGAFTLALADLIGPVGVIYSVDRDSGALRQQQGALASRFPSVTIHTLTADFTTPLDFPPLDGIVMANSLHFVPVNQRQRVLGLVRSYLQPGGRLILVEYDSDHGNIWVPHPMSYRSWEQIAREAGFSHTEHLAAVPSHFMGAIYSALSW